MRWLARGEHIALAAWVLIALQSCSSTGSSAGDVNRAISPQARESQTSPSPLDPNTNMLPGASSFQPELTEQFAAKWKKRGSRYRPRTRHLRVDGSAKYTNRLFLSSSPYLLQHAHNPVNWYPWGNEAFETAKRLGRPVLLSVGYSTCHWCHVMEEESFEDEEIARYMNENYVVIKVDREEHPDVDAIHMSAVQTLTGGGGWPMTVWLTPERKPFYGGTYFPARDGDRGARVGFLTLLKKLKETYDSQPDRVAQSAEQITAAIQQKLAPPGVATGLPDFGVLRAAASTYSGRFDATNGINDHQDLILFAPSSRIGLVASSNRETPSEGATGACRRLGR